MCPACLFSLYLLAPIPASISLHDTTRIVIATIFYAGRHYLHCCPLFDIIGEGKVMAPTVPGSSDHECLSAHSEVLVLQETLGISYKDAAHRLYMAELERVKTDQKMYKAFITLQGSTEKTLTMAYKSVKVIESTAPHDGPASS
ncbi:hypothetical protein BYT27DRAFT_7217388 [Phlegmacium glaucopus]|nr:hypothetical protein BYT27DRAFT_7217388 [Phlegmacium glaucopus]